MNDTSSIIDAIQELRAEMNARFDAVDFRLEELSTAASNIGKRPPAT